MQLRTLPPLASLLGLVLVLLCAVPANAQLFETKAAQAFMIDADTGTVLFAKDPDKPIPPASMAKLMTMEVVFNALKAKRMTLDDTFVVSENAWRTGGAPSGTSTMFAKLKSEVRVEDLIQGTIEPCRRGKDGWSAPCRYRCGSRSSCSADGRRTSPIRSTAR